MPTLASSLRQRARAVRRYPAGGERVEGSTPMVDAHGAWVRARVTPEWGPEADDTGRGRRYVIRAATLIVAAIDEDGEPVEIRASDRIQVEAGATWRVAGEPQRLEASHGRLLGWLVRLRALDEPTREAA